MSDAKVIAFPPRAAPTSQPERHRGRDSYRDWLSWVECELAILGYDLSACDYDWRAAHTKGLRPEAAAAAAAQRHETA
jgi:hypothetical protein